MHRDSALEAAILAHPDDLGAYAVYADWLLERGDPRGELMSVQLRREQAPDDAELASREAALIAEHGPGWLAHLVGRTWLDHPIEVTWRRGFVDTAEIRPSYDSDEAAFAYRQLAELPVAIALRGLSLGVSCSHHGRGPADVSVLEALRDMPLPCLRDLSLVNHHELSWTHVGELAIAMPALHRLESLMISAGRMTLGAIDLPQLRSLHLYTGGLDASVLADLARAAWPRLETLEIFLGTDNYGGTCTLEDTRPFLDGAVVPHVRVLALCNGTFADDLAAEVARSKILPRLARLDLSKGTMGEAGATEILRHADAFAHLEALDLGENYIPAALCDELARICAKVDISSQKVEDEWGRFVSVGE